MTLYYGMAQWQHPAWVDWLYSSQLPSSERLVEYSNVFNSVEVGSTFYAPVSDQQLMRWYQQVGDHFRFSFKVPQQISHQLHQRPIEDILRDWQDFQTKLSPLKSKLGATMLQLPGRLDAKYLSKLLILLNAWQLDAPLSVEVRHLDFFDKDKHETVLLQALFECQVNKVVMDSRPVFSTDAYNESLQEAQQKKPRVPCHPIATASHPVVRYVGHPDLETNHFWLDQWATKLKDWLGQGLQPSVFVHSSDNIAAPTLASWLDDKLVANGAVSTKQILLPESHEQMPLI
ncbi:DUF72 domain-containing protein [Marinomonas posidonica]|uniref:DUF72 domain-containing protein n=1 Tax=Marinomonas posidonica (strain CECT 7376 / NCIMB 14433 / IVIA-Po-181) TaxID=491952 RepID=F6D0D0_MARPP|nr:DUF72 domain-containing protein [Marinomonas posidonica]AEF53652.1 protein of unknown function DUF72 [Marinomonas posidonica IVIA-Po-181]